MALNYIQKLPFHFNLHKKRPKFIDRSYIYQQSVQTESYKYELVIEDVKGEKSKIWRMARAKHIKSHKSSFGINVIMMENVLFIRKEREILKHYDLSPLENVFLAATQHLNVYILAVILFTFIVFSSHIFIDFTCEEKNNFETHRTKFACSCRSSWWMAKKLLNVRKSVFKVNNVQWQAEVVENWNFCRHKSFESV